MEDESKNPWKARLAIGLVMLGLALISLVILQIHASIYWIFCWIMAVLDAFLCVGLVIALKKHVSYKSGVIRQIWHWLGLMTVMYLLALLVDRGTVSQTEAGLFALMLLSLTLYLAGLYTDVIFVVIGVTLGLMAAGMVLIQAYLLLVMIPVFVMVALFIIVITNRQRHEEKAK